MEYSIKVKFLSGEESDFKVTQHQFSRIVEIRRRNQNGSVINEPFCANPFPTLDIQEIDGTVKIIQLSSVQSIEIDKEYIKAENIKAQEEQVRQQIASEMEAKIRRELEEKKTKVQAVNT